MNWTMAGALWGLLGVGLGAFGAHGLKGSRERAGPRVVGDRGALPARPRAGPRPARPAAASPARRRRGRLVVPRRKRLLQRHALRHGARRAALARRDHPDRRARDDARLAAARAPRAGLSALSPLTAIALHGPVHRATISVMSSCCSRGLKRRTSSTIESSSAFGGRSRPSRSASTQPLLAELLSRVVERLGDAVRVEHEQVAGRELALADRALPIREEPQDGARGARAARACRRPEQQAAQVAAVGVAQALRRVVVLGEEERGVGAVGACSRRRAGSPTRRKRCGSSSAIAHWLRRLACRFAIRSAAAMPLPAMSPITSPAALRPGSGSRSSRRPPARAWMQSPAYSSVLEGGSRLREEPAPAPAARSRARGRRGARIPPSRRRRGAAPRRPGSPRRSSPARTSSRRRPRSG